MLVLKWRKNWKCIFRTMQGHENQQVFLDTVVSGHIRSLTLKNWINVSCFQAMDGLVIVTNTELILNEKKKCDVVIWAIFSTMWRTSEQKWAFFNPDITRVSREKTVESCFYYEATTKHRRRRCEINHIQWQQEISFRRPNLTQLHCVMTTRDFNSKHINRWRYILGHP